MDIQEKIEEQKRLDLEFILGSRRGRNFLWQLLSHCGIYQDINTGDSMENERQLGRRSVGLFFLAKASEVDEDKVFQMMKEGKADALAIEVEEAKIEAEQQELNLGDLPDVENFI